MEKLKRHFPVPGDIERHIPLRTLKHKRFTVKIIHRTVQIRRSDDITIVGVIKQIPLRGKLIQAVIAPEFVRAAFLPLVKGHFKRFGIYRA